MLIVRRPCISITGECCIFDVCSLADEDRVSGYVLAVYMLAVVGAATQTSYNENVLHIKLWAVVVASILVLAGVVPRIKKHKLGF
jgi:hypothetical protein